VTFGIMTVGIVLSWDFDIWVSGSRNFGVCILVCGTLVFVLCIFRILVANAFGVMDKYNIVVYHMIYVLDVTSLNHTRHPVGNDLPRIRSNWLRELNTRYIHSDCTVRGADRIGSESSVLDTFNRLAPPRARIST